MTQLVKDWPALNCSKLLDILGSALLVVLIGNLCPACRAGKGWVEVEGLLQHSRCPINSQIKVGHP